MAPARSAASAPQQRTRLASTAIHSRSPKPSVPAGSKVRYADKQHSIPVSIELPRAARSTVCDVRRGDAVTLWGGILAGDQWLDGLPCRSGPYRFGDFQFDEAGTIHRCALASEHELLGPKLPTGTRGSAGEEITTRRL